MKIRYTPPDAAAQTWDFDLRRLTMGELKAIKKHTGIAGLVELGEGLQKYDPDAVCAFVWVLRKRYEDPTLAYEAVDLAVGDIDFTDEEEVPKEEDSPSASQTLRSVAGG